MESGGKVHPDCINASNPYHECVEYCFKRIAEAKSRADESKDFFLLFPLVVLLWNDLCGKFILFS